MTYPRWKDYDGYESYQHLEPGDDYEEFDLVEGISPFEAAPVELSREEEDRLFELMNDRITIAVHEHPINHPKDMTEVFDYIESRHLVTHYDGLSRTPLDAVFDALLHGVEMMETNEGFQWTDVISDLSMRLDDITRSDLLIQGRTVDDIRHAHETGRIAWFPALETLTPIGNVLDRLDMLHGMGLRMAGLTYNETNQLATGSNEVEDAGLTAFGRQAVERMNKLGMAIGLSHESEGTILDVCDASTDPVFLSHTAAEALWETKRARPDEVFEAVAETGGIIALEGAHSTQIEEEAGHTIEGMMRHFEYVVDLVGIESVSFATDTLYGDDEAMMDVCAQAFSVAEVFTPEGAEEPGGTEKTHVVGNENPTEAWNNIPRWLIKHGYTDAEVAAVTGGNTLRVLEETFD
ncbi:MAG: membrane dipeptidase [Halobacteriales archaeon]|nr:membrane dipeptidase [Halobacteriales archaeon]